MNGKNAEKNEYVVTKVSIADTFRSLPTGKPVVCAVDITPIGTRKDCKHTWLRAASPQDIKKGNP